MGKKLIIVLFIVIIAIICLFFLNQRWIILNFPFKDFTSYGQLMDTGYISNRSKKYPILYSLPVCPDLADHPVEYPIVKYYLETNNVNLDNLLFKPVKIWGKVNVKSKVLKPPEIVCIKSPCILSISERIMSVKRIEIDNQPLSTCEQAYLE